jgi:hypothetical protein
MSHFEPRLRCWGSLQPNRAFINSYSGAPYGNDAGQQGLPYLMLS